MDGDQCGYRQETHLGDHRYFNLVFLRVPKLPLRPGPILASEVRCLIWV